MTRAFLNPTAAVGSALIPLLILAWRPCGVWALVDAIRVPDDRDYRAGTELVWVLVIALTGLTFDLAAGRAAASRRSATCTSRPRRLRAECQRSARTPPDHGV